MYKRQASQLAQPLPIRVIAEALGASTDDYEFFRISSQAFTDQLSGTSTPEEHIEIAKKLVKFQHFPIVRINTLSNNFVSIDPTHDGNRLYTRRKIRFDLSRSHLK